MESGSLLSWLSPAGGSADCGEDVSDSQSEVCSVCSESDLGSNDDHIPEIPESAHQPFLRSFPKRTFGKQQRSFCSAWYAKFPWLHYQEGEDKAYCFHCLVSSLRHYPVSLNKDDAFIKNGFSDWKRALDKFQKHQLSHSHRQAVSFVTSTTKDVGEMVQKGYAEQKAENRKILLTIFNCVRFLGRQGLALRGEYKGEEKSEIDSNLMQLLLLIAIYNPQVSTWLKRTQNRFTSPDIQNEMLSMMALSILREIRSRISDKWFTIMVDETTDMSNTEQMVFCLRHVDDHFDVHEEVIGLHSLESTSADSIVFTIKDILLRLNLRIDHCRGQCYDGASAMSGVRSGVSTQIAGSEPRALYTHCYGHALNLATQDAIKGVKLMADTLETVYEITKLIKKSPKRQSIFKNIKSLEEISTGSIGIRILCPTRWTVRAEALASIAENYDTLQLTWDAAKDATKDSEMRARIGGVKAQMSQFNFFFGIELGRKILNMVDNLSRSLQATSMSACEGQRIVGLTLTTLQSIRSDESFQAFWNVVEIYQASLDVTAPTLPRQRKVPRRYETGESAPEYPRSVQDHYQRIYFEAIDLVTSAIKRRFDQKGFQMLQKLESILIEPNQPNKVKEVTEFYGSDFNPDLLTTQLNVLHTSSEVSLVDLKSVVAYLKTLNSIEREFFSEVVNLVKLILVMPATNAVSERSFSALRRLKTWLRSTMSQSRLNWCMVLNVHREKTDELPMTTLLNEFIGRCESRMRTFGL